MSAASSSVQAAPRSVQPGVAFAAILLTAAVVLVLLAVGRPTATGPQAAPVAGNAPTLHDRGWATAAGQDAPASAPILHDRGSSSAAIEASAASTTSGTDTPQAAPGAGPDADGPSRALRHR